jgi:hypothetical protein
MYMRLQSVDGGAERSVPPDAFCEKLFIFIKLSLFGGRQMKIKLAAHPHFAFYTYVAALSLDKLFGDGYP